MGLDTYASRSPDDAVLTAEDSAVFEAAGIELCGGIYSDGSVSIRGKVYDDLISEVAEISLYQEWIPPDDVATISRALDEYEAEALVDVWDTADPFRGPHSSVEAGDLQVFFRLCVERGLGLIGWW
ncbi:MAG TPA: hypothetical protein VFE45_01670 [Coriobacteriia bacterium]|nr:hypothetical protein [Coriobacteriia bacterium]